MERKELSLKELKKRKMLMILPVLVLPFLTMLIWSLGGGQSKINSTVLKEKQGFNVSLPNPQFKEESTLDKMSYYDNAEMDSIKFLEEMEKDPNYSKRKFADDFLAVGGGLEDQRLKKSKTALIIAPDQDPNEQRIHQKLKALQNAISQPSPVLYKDRDMEEFKNYESSLPLSSEMNKLEQMMAVMNEPQEADPELKQLEGMLDNILDIQHPKRMEDKLRQSAQDRKEKTFRVVRRINEDNVSLLATTKSNALKTALNPNSFYTLDEDTISHDHQNAIEAVMHQTQTVVNGSIIKLRLKNDVLIQNEIIPSNSFLFGLAVLKGERVEVIINSIRYGQSIFPVDLSVFDLDGIEGIYIPGTITRDVAKVSADRSIQTLGTVGLEDSWGAQAAGMGIEAAKSLMSRKVKLVKVMIKAGYRVLLYDKKQKDSN